MLHEYSRVRTKEKGLIGTIVDFQPNETYCTVELDFWQTDVYRDDYSTPVSDFELSDLEELTKVSGAARKLVFENFDTITLSSNLWINFSSGLKLVIKRLPDGLEVLVQNLFKEVDKSKSFTGSECSELLVALFGMHADRWTETFEPKGYMVMDGYGWTMEVLSGNKYFTCDGDNYAPSALIDLLTTLHELGLPQMWNDGEIRLNGRGAD